MAGWIHRGNGQQNGIELVCYFFALCSVNKKTALKCLSHQGLEVRHL